MHLSLVRKLSFEFDPAAADFHIQIPEGALAATLADAPTGETPRGLEGFRYWLSDAEEGSDEMALIYLADMAGDRDAVVVPLMTLHHAKALIASEFAQWQARRASRSTIRLECALAVEDGSRAITINILRGAA